MARFRVCRGVPAARGPPAGWVRRGPGSERAGRQGAPSLRSVGVPPVVARVVSLLRSLGLSLRTALPCAPQSVLSGPPPLAARLGAARHGVHPQRCSQSALSGSLGAACALTCAPPAGRVEGLRVVEAAPPPPQEAADSGLLPRGPRDRGQSQSARRGPAWPDPGLRLLGVVRVSAHSRGNRFARVASARPTPESALLAASGPGTRGGGPVVFQGSPSPPLPVLLSRGLCVRALCPQNSPCREASQPQGRTGWAGRASPWPAACLRRRLWTASRSRGPQVPGLGCCSPVARWQPNLLGLLNVI